MKGSHGVSVGVPQGLHDNHRRPIPMAKHQEDLSLPPPVDAVLRIAPYPKRLVMEVYLKLFQQQQQQLQLQHHHDGLSNDVTRTLRNDAATGHDQATHDGADVFRSDARRVESRVDDSATIDVITASRLLLAVEEEAAARKRGERDEVTTEMTENLNSAFINQFQFQTLGDSLPLSEAYMEEDAGEFDSDTSNNGITHTSGGDDRNAHDQRLSSSITAADGRVHQNNVDMERSTSETQQNDNRQSNDSENLLQTRYQNISQDQDENLSPVQPHPSRAQVAAAETSPSTTRPGDEPNVSRHSDEDEVTVSDEETRERRRHQEKLRALRSENRRLRNRNTCRQCRQRPVSLTLLPCGHFLFCRECGSTFTACPVCHKTILADVHTFMG